MVKITRIMFSKFYPNLQVYALPGVSPTTSQKTAGLIEKETLVMKFHTMIRASKCTLRETAHCCRRFLAGMVAGPTLVLQDLIRV